MMSNHIYLAVESLCLKRNDQRQFDHNSHFRSMKIHSDRTFTYKCAHPRPSVYRRKISLDLFKSVVRQEKVHKSCNENSVIHFTVKPTLR